MYKEDVNFRMSETEENLSVFKQYQEEIEDELKILAKQTNKSQLDRLEFENLEIWAMRLSLHNDNDDTDKRVEKYLDHEDYEIRFIAQKIWKLLKGNPK